MSYTGVPTDGSAWEEEGGGKCALRVLRGGAWNSEPRDLRSANRGGNTTGDRDYGIGFRLAQDL